MAKHAAVLAVDPVNGMGLFQYLEAFYENKIPYTVYAVAGSKEIRTNSGLGLTVNDVIANLKGREDEYDAVVFACGDAVPVFGQHASEPWNVDLMEVLKTFGEQGKLMIGHCAAGMMFDLAGVAAGKRLAVHPLAKAAIRQGTATDEKSVIDGHFFTAQTENTIWTMMPQLIETLKA
ncbi:DJ-1/PfpI family protein [uncultured Rikenella sp.]|uniref:DJ-1/PfpI family protein n=1 Tax=uncultured Rikenella sp. TaxID=368003 RepID=UPI00260E7733|nr:DJ-1/PfpI family protein [uncultured Rikenella sp.]